jgi:hypothetical protein
MHQGPCDAEPLMGCGGASQNIGWYGGYPDHSEGTYMATIPEIEARSPLWAMTDGLRGKPEPALEALGIPPKDHGLLGPIVPEEKVRGVFDAARRAQ